MTAGEQTALAEVVEVAASLVERVSSELAERCVDNGRISTARMDEHQVLAYDLAHVASAVEAARVMTRYAEHGELESLIARAFVADVVADLMSRMLGREEIWGASLDQFAPTAAFVAAHRFDHAAHAVA